MKKRCLLAALSGVSIVIIAAALVLGQPSGWSLFPFIAGGTSVGGNLQLQSTTNSTEGSILLDTAVEVNADGSVDFDTQPRVSLTQNLQLISTTTTTYLDDYTEEYDTDDMYDAVTNTERITINTEGFYLCRCYMKFDGSDPDGIITVYINNLPQSDQTASATETPLLDGSSTDRYVDAWSIDWYEVDDYLYCYVYQNSGTSVWVGASESRFSCFKIH